MVKRRRRRKDFHFLKFHKPIVDHCDFHSMIKIRYWTANDSWNRKRKEQIIFFSLLSLTMISLSESLYKTWKKILKKKTKRTKITPPKCSQLFFVVVSIECKKHTYEREKKSIYHSIFFHSFVLYSYSLRVLYTNTNLSFKWWQQQRSIWLKSNTFIHYRRWNDDE